MNAQGTKHSFLSFCASSMYLLAEQIQKNLEPFHQNHNSLDLEGILKTIWPSLTNFIRGKPRLRVVKWFVKGYPQIQTQKQEKPRPPHIRLVLSSVSTIKARILFAGLTMSLVVSNLGQAHWFFGSVKRSREWEWLFLSHFTASRVILIKENVSKQLSQPNNKCHLPLVNSLFSPGFYTQDQKAVTSLLLSNIPWTGKFKTFS